MAQALKVLLEGEIDVLKLRAGGESQGLKPQAIRLQSSVCFCSTEIFCTMAWMGVS